MTKEMPDDELFECDECGADVSLNDDFCPSCGTEFAETDDELSEEKPSEQNQCPSCSTKLSGGLLRYSSMIAHKKLALLNLILHTNEVSRCSKCVEPFVNKAREKIEKEKENLEGVFQKGLRMLPVATIHLPPRWDFEVLGLVSGQSVTGTGIFAEIFSDVTDFFGAQSETFNKKLRKGESLCLSQVKTKTFELGGNAIVGLDIDYSGVGGAKGMLMVCMAGTAIRLKNIDEIQPNIGKILGSAISANEMLKVFERFNKAFT